MIHWRLSVEKCSARCAEGSAMLTIVASSTTISCAVPRSARTAQRFGSEWFWVSAVICSAARWLLHQDAVEPSDPKADDQPLGVDHRSEERRLIQLAIERRMHLEELAARLVARRGGDLGELGVALRHGEGPEVR